MSGYRLPDGGRIDRSRPVRFTFDGKVYRGFEGDTLASALLASGVSVFGRSFKYHRPRGVVGAGAEEPNALVTVRRGPGRATPNLRATQVEIYEGLEAESQNRWPSLRWDLGAINDRLSPLFPAGFYNKTFMWPRSFWEKLYEPAIRRMAGLGEPPREADPDTYAGTYAHCELVIVGAGPAGLEAALAEAGSDKRLILIDEQSEIGGGALTDPALAGWLNEARARIAAAANIRVLTRTTAFGYFHDNFIAAIERRTEHLADIGVGPREKLWRIRAGEVVLAQGAIERPLVFPGNDRPGVMLSSAARAYAQRFGIAVGRAPLVFAAHDSGWRDALALASAGIRCAAIVDARATVREDLIAEAKAARIPVRLGETVTSVAGRHGVQAVSLSGGSQIVCDAVLMAGGWTPSVHLWSHSRGKLVWDEAWGAYLPGEAAERARCVGACAGAWDFGQGATLAPTGAPKAFVDFQNDVTAKDIRLAVREGFRSVEHIKRYTTNGMATDQGKTSTLNALAIAADALGKTSPEVGLTTFRPPYTPQTFGALAGTLRGDLFQPLRKTTIDPWAEAQGAVFELVGPWRRAHYFPKGGEDMHAAVARECLAVRNSVGMFDASTLGKIEVVGPNAAVFLERMYVNAWKGLAPGRCRYGLMLREDGFIYDDGVIGRMAPDRFHVTTTTGGAPRVLAMMEDYRQTEWPDLDVWLTSTTEEWAVIAVQGPRAREVIAPLVEGIDLSPEAFPHMAVRTGKVAGAPSRLFRVSFTGELGYEVNVPADRGRAVWEAIADSGARFGITPYGTETMHVLRAEKGFIIVGQDTDGTVTPEDAGLAGMIAKKKPDFVGKRSLARPDMLKSDRKQLVGLLTDDPKVVLEEGAQIVADPRQAVPMTMLGHVTSSYWSATLNRSIALALVTGGRARMGDALHVPMPGATHRVRVVETVFHDAEGARLHV